MKHLFKVMAVAVFAIALMSCPMGEDQDPADDKTVGIDWTSYGTSGVFGIRNSTTERLVAFKNSVATSNMVGGVEAVEQNHYFKRNPALFSQTEDFPLILITEKQYNDNKGKLQELNEKPFTRIYVFYNNDPQADRILYEISGSLGGASKLFVQNASPYNIELRLGGVGGETIGYAPAEMNYVTLQMNPVSVDIFPVIKYYNPTRNTVSTIFPKSAQGYAWFRSYDFSDSTQTLTFNAQDFLAQLTGQQKSIGASWININNQTAGAIMLQLGNDLYTNPTTGSRYVNSGRSLIWQVDMDKTGNTYMPNKLISMMKVGVTGIMVDVKTSDGATSFTIESDKQYAVNVTGDPMLDTLVATINIEGAVAVDFDGVTW
jgi:hypothetical protein